MVRNWGHWLTLAASTLMVAGLVLGCGDDEAEHLRRLGAYTPENVAEELLSRFKNLGQVQEKTSEARGISEDSAKGIGAVTKGGRSGSAFDQLIDDIAAKAARVEKTPPADVFREIGAKVDADGSVTAKDRERIKTALQKAMKL